MDAVAKAAPGGHTIGFGAISTNALNPHSHASMPFDPRTDFDAIGLLGISSLVLEGAAGSALLTVLAPIAAAEKEPVLAYPTSGARTSMHLAGVVFAQMSRLTRTHVPHRGGGPAITDLIGGNVGVMFDDQPAWMC